MIQLRGAGSVQAAVFATRPPHAPGQVHSGSPFSSPPEGGLENEAPERFIQQRKPTTPTPKRLVVSPVQRMEAASYRTEVRCEGFYSSAVEVDWPGVEEPSRPVKAVVSRLLAAGRTRRNDCAQAGLKP